MDQLIVGNPNHIETTCLVAFNGLGVEIVLGNTSDLHLLRSIDGFQRRSMGLIGATPHFDENELHAIEGDDVQLSQGTSIVLRQNSVSL